MRRGNINAGVLIAALAFAGVIGSAMLAAAPAARAQPAADPGHGARLIYRYGCGSCHQIPGIDAANGRVGPPLMAIGRRAYLGGVIPNDFDNMVTWLRNPQAIDPRSAMPDVGLDEQQARDIAAYLYTLQ